ncbi:MAG TPA: TIGR03808 family TAT-translocated repetitive protein [Aestuariivirga sp.]|nr:TIGR03808 family TAT-translocated repetitive protein [Aestuariivirga sp.]
MNFARRSLLAGLPLLMAGATQAKTNQISDLQRELEKAIRDGGVLRLPAGSFKVSGLRITGSVQVEGVPGLTTLVSEGGSALIIEDADDVTISGVNFEGGEVLARNAKRLKLEACGFINSKAGGLRLENCSGRVCGNNFSDIAQTALFARDSQGLEIFGNHVHDIGNNGIQVWTSAPTEDGTIISNNRVERIKARDGGTGQNGNGINIYKASNVMVSGNRISDCAFSAIRNNSGSNCQIIGNSISRTGEVAIYCEFAFEGAVVSNNLIEDVAFGISLTNFNEGGRLAVIANNLVRKVKGGGSLAYTSAVGIAAEADATLTGNVIEEAADAGINLGWGKYCRNLSASGNLIRNCGRGIAFSASIGAGPVMITGNNISGAKAAIQGMNFAEPVTEDLALASATIPPGSMIQGNLIG